MSEGTKQPTETDQELAGELAWYCLGRIEKHLGIRGAELDADCDTEHFLKAIEELRKDFDVPVAVPPLVPTLRGGTCCCIATSDEGTVDSSRCSIHQPITPLIKVGQSFDFLPLVPTSSVTSSAGEPLRAATDEEIPHSTIDRPSPADSPVGAREHEVCRLTFLDQLRKYHWVKWGVNDVQMAVIIDAMIAFAASQSSSREEAVRELVKAVDRRRIMYSRDHGMPNPTPAFPTHVTFSLKEWKAVESALAKVKEVL